MAGLWQIGLGVFILLMLPAALCAADGRKLPMLANAVLAVTGLLYSTVAGGWPGALSSFVSGAASAALLAIVVAATQKRSSRRLMSGAEIQLFAAAAMWLSPAFAALACLTIAAFAVAWITSRRMLGFGMSRPLLPMLIAAPLVFGIFGHN